MRLLAINGSPREHGNTQRILSEILKGSEGEGVEIEYLRLAELEFSDCTGCGYCKRNQHCRLEDDMQRAYAAIRRADAVLLGSPIYMGAETGMTKCFLDRLYAFLDEFDDGFTSRLPPGKKAIIFFTCDRHDGNVVYYSVSTRCSRIFKLYLGFDEVQTFIIPGASLHENILDSDFATQVVAVACGLITGSEDYGDQDYDDLMEED